MSLSKIAITSVAAKSIKTIVAPLTILSVASNLSAELMGFYFTFLSVIAGQALLEVGIGHVLKQHIAHSLQYDEFGSLTSDSLNAIKSYSVFTFKWYLVLSLFVIFIIGLGGYFFFYSYSGDIDWVGPWFLLVTCTGISVFISSISVIFEGLQEQIKLYQAQMFSGVFSSLILIWALYYGLELYSLSLFVILNPLVLVIFLRKKIISIKLQFSNANSEKSFNDIFREVYSLLSKVSIIWFVGFFFWHSFNLISFKFVSPEFAGVLGFSMSLARAGFNVSESIVSGQMTRFSYLFKSKDINFVIGQFKRYRNISVLFLITGYSFFGVFSYYFREKFDFFSKILNSYEFFQIFLFFVLTLLITLQCNFIRCLKVEPFLVVSVFRSLSIPLVFYYMITNNSTETFGVLSILLVVFYFLVLNISNKEIRKYKNKRL